MNMNGVPILKTEITCLETAKNKNQGFSMFIIFDFFVMFFVSLLFYYFTISFVCLFGVFRPTREFFTQIEKSPLPVKGCII